jgi:hypothetical protein
MPAKKKMSAPAEVVGDMLVWGTYHLAERRLERKLSDVLNSHAPGVSVSKTLHEWQPVREVASCAQSGVSS